jgi:hypothetical protein
MAPRKTPRKPRHEPEVEAAKKAATAKKPRKSRAVPGAKIGRPSKYTPELADRICAELSRGRSLNSVCKADDVPSIETIFRWIGNNSDFRNKYEKAKAESADFLVEEMLDIADDGRNDWMETFDNEGNSAGWKLNGEHVQRSRLRVDVRKWAASKLKPKKYGERLDMNHGIQPEDPLAALIKSVQGASFGPIPRNAIEHTAKKDEDDDE